MILHFVPKEPGRAYVSNSLWLPKSEVRAGPVKKALEFVISTEKGNILLREWLESTNHLVCPREFLPSSQYANYDFPFVDLRPEFQKVEFEDLVVPRDEEQEKAWNALRMHDNGILNLACGKGKTRLGFKKIAQRGVPTLVIVPDSGILQQWQEAVHGNEAKGITKAIAFEGELGLVAGPVFKWAHPLTLALVTTLWQRIEKEAMPEEFFRYFGQVVYDEVHKIGAPKFSLTAKPFYGDRLGLTATVEREDGLDPIYRYHIGDPFYSDLTQQLIPEIFFQQTPARIDYLRAQVNNATNISILRTMLGTDLVANTFRYWHIRDALEHGRKILCLSHSKAQLKLFHAMFPDSGLIIQETRKNRMDVLRNSRVCFAIAKLAQEGVDDDALDTLFGLTPFRSKNALQQAMGRIQRVKAGKKRPVFVMFEDWLTPPIKTLCHALKAELRKWRMPFHTSKPDNRPRELPPDVKERYDRVLESLQPADDEPDSGANEE